MNSGIAALEQAYHILLPTVCFVPDPGGCGASDGGSDCGD